MGRYSQAEALYKRALEVSGRSFGAEHPAAAQAMVKLAGLYMTLGNYQRSEQLQGRHWTFSRRPMGHVSREWRRAMERMGGLYAASGDCRQALQRYRQALDITEKTVGSEHPEAANCLDGMGWAYSVFGQLRRGRRLLPPSFGHPRKSVRGNSHHGGPRACLYWPSYPMRPGIMGKAESFLYTRTLSRWEKTLSTDTTPKWPFALIAYPRCAAC